MRKCSLLICSILKFHVRLNNNGDDNKYQLSLSSLALLSSSVSKGDGEADASPAVDFLATSV